MKFRLTPFAVLVLALSSLHSALAAPDLYSPVLDSLRADVIARTSATSSSYEMDLVLDERAHTISGTEKIDYVNSSDQTLTEVAFRLFPNADYYAEGSLEIVRARVEGKLVAPRLDTGDTVLYLPLDAPLAPGERVNLALRFTTTIPVDSEGTFGIFSIDSTLNSWSLADWYPVLAGWEPDKGFVVDAPTPAGDPTFSEAALYDVKLDIPASWGMAASGDQRSVRIRNNRQLWEIVTGPAREIAIVLDDDLQTISGTSGETRINVSYDGNNAGAEGARQTLDIAASALQTYSDAFGAYPYDELDLVETKMNGALGVSWAGLIFLNGSRVLANPEFTTGDPERLRFTVAHEVGHQWWGSMLGMNSNDHAFLVEGLTNYLSIYALEQIDGEAAAQQQLRVQSVTPYLNMLDQHGDGIADLSIVDAPQEPPFGTLIYGKAALGFLAIREELGDDEFFDAIRNWADEAAFRITGPDQLLASFEAETNKDIAAVWKLWFQTADVTPEDVQALLDND